MEMNYQEILENIKQNPAAMWGIALLSAVLFSSILKLIINFASSRFRKIAQQNTYKWDDIGLDLVDGLKMRIIFIWAFYILSKSLPAPVFVHRLLLIATVLGSVYQTIIWGFYVIRNWRTDFLEKRVEANPSSAAAIGLMYTSIQTVFIIVVVLIALSNLGIDITALITGLGVGGIAVALAAQNVLGDLLASLSIVLDKPFVVGDFIVTGTEVGTVEHIGIKTTRIRSLSGEQLIVSNKDLLESRLRNYKRMQQRRVVQKFGVVYSTSAETLEQIPIWVKEIVQKYDKLTFDRCHFCGYGDSSLDFELVFIVLDPEYNIFMDLQQNVLLDIFRTFQKNKVDFAFPSRTLYVESLPAGKPYLDTH